jgi:hypothetical protein
MTTPRPRSADADPTRPDASADEDRQDDTRRTREEPAGQDVRDVDTAEKPVEEWVTGDEPMTGPQRSYLQTLAHEAGEDLPEEELTKAAASELIERLQRATGRIPADRQR